MIRQIILTAAYRYASHALCRERGHGWRTTTTSVTTGFSSRTVEECRTCEKRRLEPITTATSNSTTKIEFVRESSYDGKPPSGGWTSFSDDVSEIEWDADEPETNQ